MAGFYGLWFRVQGSGFEVYCPLIGMKASYEWGMRNEGGGFAASIYEAMPKVAFSHQSLKAPNP